MSIRCSMLGHDAGTAHHHNQGLEFAICHHCACDLVRAEDQDWTEVPRGFRVVWREFGRTADAAAVAARMHRAAATPRRRDPRNARPKPHRDRRGRPIRGATSVIGMFAGLGGLLDSEPASDDAAEDPSGQYVICLPGAGG
jgi:hypothetical protein